MKAQGDLNNPHDNPDELRANLIAFLRSKQNGGALLQTSTGTQTSLAKAIAKEFKRVNGTQKRKCETTDRLVFDDDDNKAMLSTGNDLGVWGPHEMGENREEEGAVECLVFDNEAEMDAGDEYVYMLIDGDGEGDTRNYSSSVSSSEGASEDHTDNNGEDGEIEHCAAEDTCMSREGLALPTSLSVIFPNSIFWSDLRGSRQFTDHNVSEPRREDKTADEAAAFSSSDWEDLIQEAFRDAILEALPPTALMTFFAYPFVEDSHTKREEKERNRATRTNGVGGTTGERDTEGAHTALPVSIRSPSWSDFRKLLQRELSKRLRRMHPNLVASSESQKCRSIANASSFRICKLLRNEQVLYGHSQSGSEGSGESRNEATVLAALLTARDSYMYKDDALIAGNSQRAASKVTNVVNCEKTDTSVDKKRPRVGLYNYRAELQRCGDFVIAFCGISPSITSSHAGFRNKTECNSSSHRDKAVSTCKYNKICEDVESVLSSEVWELYILSASGRVMRDLRSYLEREVHVGVQQTADQRDEKELAFKLLVHILLTVGLWWLCGVNPCVPTEDDKASSRRNSGERGGRGEKGTPRSNKLGNTNPTSYIFDFSNAACDELLQGSQPSKVQQKGEEIPFPNMYKGLDLRALFTMTSSCPLGKQKTRKPISGGKRWYPRWAEIILEEQHKGPLLNDAHRNEEDETGTYEEGTKIFSSSSKDERLRRDYDELFGHAQDDHSGAAEHHAQQLLCLLIDFLDDCCASDSGIGLMSREVNVVNEVEPKKNDVFHYCLAANVVVLVAQLIVVAALPYLSTICVAWTEAEYTLVVRKMAESPAISAYAKRNCVALAPCGAKPNSVKLPTMSLEEKNEGRSDSGRSMGDHLSLLHFALNAALDADPSCLSIALLCVNPFFLRVARVEGLISTNNQ